MYGYIYLTTNLINNKKYIGQHKGAHNPNYLGTGIAIKNAIIKYGKENFKNEVLCWCETKEEMDLKEIEFIEKFNAVENKEFYNQDKGGRGGILYERRDGKHNPFFGKVPTESHKKKISEALKGKKRSPEVIAKLPQNQKGYKLSEEQKIKLGKKQQVLDTQTNEVFEFTSVKELCETLNIKRSKYDNDKRYKRELIANRYKLIAEEQKYERS